MSGSATDGQRNRDDRTSEDVQSHDPLCDYSHNPSITCGCAVIRTHDPLCGYRLYHSEDSPCDMCRCDCDLIARVRADEQKKHDGCICVWSDAEAWRNGRLLWVGVGGVVYRPEDEVRADEREQAAQRIDGHSQHGYRCECGADLNNYERHLQNVIRGEA